MSHVDEGALHAYLDGALDEFPSAEAEKIRSHLDACPECADRLEAERRIRADAHAMLGLAVPRVDVPSFEELRAYVQRTRPRRAGVSRIQRMGWAASVVLALGAGWMIREGQLQSRALEVGRDRGSAPATQAPSSAEATDRGLPSGARQTTVVETAPAAEAPLPAGRPTGETAAGRDADAPAAYQTGRGEGAPTFTEAVARQSEQRRREPSSALLSRLPDDVAEAAGTVSVGSAVTADVLAEAPDPSAVTDMLPDAPALRSVSESVAPASPVDSGALALEAVVVTNTDAPTGAAMPAGVITPVEFLAPPTETITIVALEDRSTLPSDSGAAAAAVREAQAEPAAREAREADPIRADSPAALTSALRATDREASTEVAEEGVAEAESPPGPGLAVPGYEVLEVTNLGSGTTPWGVRVRQRTEDGTVFEVHHLEAGVDPSILPEPAPGMEEAGQETPTGWIFVRGPLTATELGELLGRLLPPPR